MKMENEKEVPLVNGGRDAKSDSMDDDSAEKQPCLPGGERPSPPPQPFDEVDKRQKLSSASSNSSLAKVRTGSFDRKKKPRLRARVEERLRRRTGLSRPGLLAAALLLALLLVFLIIIVALACSWPSTPHQHLFPVCTRAACLQASAQILPKMDDNVPPCADFWRYSCGGWLKGRLLGPSRSHWSLAEEQALKHHEHLRTLLTTLPHQRDSRSTTWKLQNLYESCMRIDNIESDGARPLLKLIQLLGGWSVLRDFSQHSWDIRTVWVKLFSAHAIMPFFQIHVVPDPRNNTRSIIQILPSELDLPDKSYYQTPDSYFITPSAELWSANLGQVCVDLSNVTSLQAFFRRLGDMNVLTAFTRYLKDVAILLGAQSSEASIFSKDMFYYQHYIASVMPEREELLDPFVNIERVSIANLNLQAPSIPLLDILQAMFPGAGIHQNTEVLVFSSAYLSRISVTLTAADRRPLNEYMMWLLASSYTPYMNKEFRDVDDIYKRVLTGAETSVERWEMCISTLEKYMGVALAALSERTKANDPNYMKSLVENSVHNMFENIRDTVRSSVAKASWFEKELKEYILQKINTVSLQVGLPSSALSDEYLRTYYNLLPIQRNDFFQNVRNAREFQISQLNRKLMAPKEEYSWIDVAATGKRVSYIPTSNKVIIPFWLLAPPFFHPHHPLSIQYGGLGVQIAYALVSSVLPWNVLYDSEGLLQSEDGLLVNQSVASVKRAKGTIFRDLLANGIASEAVANHTLLNTVIHTSAMHQAYMAMTEALLSLPHMHQPGMETYESDQLFFLTHAQNLCSMSTLQQLDIDVTTSKFLNGSQLLPAALKHLREFTKAFSCRTSSEHFASNPCREIL